MNIFSHRCGWGMRCGLLLLGALSAISSHAQTCLTANDMDSAVNAALTSTAQNYFQMVAAGDSASLKQNAISGLAANFAGIEGAVRDNQIALSGIKGAPRAPFLLQVDGANPQSNGEFLCGVFGPNGQTAGSAVFQIPNLAPGTYAVTTVDAGTGKGPYTVTFVLEKQGNTWKLGGLYIKPLQAAGHDGNWYAQQARDFKAKGKTESAWLYYQQARELLVPVPFMSSMLTDKLYDEAQTVKPPDLPPFELVGAGKTFKVTALFPLAVQNDLDVVVKYESSSVANTAQTFQENAAVMKALLARHPELRETFQGIIARAVEPSGRDYGSMLAMKDVK
jgi:hypothetical protein